MLAQDIFVNVVTSAGSSRAEAHVLCSSQPGTSSSAAAPDRVELPVCLALVTKRLGQGRGAREPLCFALKDLVLSVSQTQLGTLTMDGSKHAVGATETATHVPALLKRLCCLDGSPTAVFTQGNRQPLSACSCRQDAMASAVTSIREHRQLHFKGELFLRRP